MAASDWQPPPTYELPIQLRAPVDAQDELPSRIAEQLARATFSSNWLNWFLRLGALLSALGAGSGGILHNLLSSLQGGTTDEYYHLTAAEYTALGSANADGILAGDAFHHYPQPAAIQDSGVLITQVFGG